MTTGDDIVVGTSTGNEIVTVVYHAGLDDQVKWPSVAGTLAHAHPVGG
jgi:hypothetical protein